MTDLPPDAGQHMAREIAEAPGTFAASVAQPVTLPDLTRLRAFYTVARGSSDAAANILAYEIMRETGLPVTSLPPSVFSLGRGVRLDDSAVLVVSQSGASDDLVRSAKGARAAGATVLALTNAPGSPVEACAHATLRIGAGPELAVPDLDSSVGAVQNVFRLEIEVQDSLSVNVLQGRGDRVENRDGPRERPGPARFHPRPQRPPGQILHHQVAVPLRLPGVVDGHHVRVIQRRQEPRLEVPARLARGSRGRVEKHLHRHLAVECEVHRPIHDPRTTLADLFPQFETRNVRWVEP